jgi:RNA polymerase sigma-70 factor, ECF subfamily
LEILENVEGWRIVQRSDDAGDPDISLVLASQRGDVHSMELLLSRHEKAIGGVCYGVLGNREDAEDAAQEAFVQAVRAMKSFRMSSTFRTWLYRIAVNTCLNYRRRKRPVERWQDVSEHECAVASPESATLSRLFAAQALSQLMPKQRAIIILREVEGLTAQEIGEAMGWNEQKVRNELFKARQLLRRWVRAQAPEVGQ